MTKKLLTREEKLELITSGEKFICEGLAGRNTRYFFFKDMIFYEHYNSKHNEHGYSYAMNLNWHDFICQDIYKYEEIGEEWVEIKQEYWKYPYITGERWVKKSWVIDVARNIGMEFKDEQI